MLKKVAIVGLIVLLIAAVVAYFSYSKLNDPIVDQDSELFIYPGDDYDALLNTFDTLGALVDLEQFAQISKMMGLSTKIKPGRYLLKKGMSTRQLVNKLKSGSQEAIRLTFNNVRTYQELAGVIASHFVFDSLDMLQSMEKQEFINKHGINKETIISLFIPNSYQLYWSSTADQVRDRLVEENEKFWNEKRMKQLEDLGLTQAEVITLASIVEKETNLKSERPTVAGVYLNRLERGIPLQADPTVVFGVGDFTIRRVLNKHLEFDSPYNTYIYPGLPPGPIYMPSINSIDAVLANEDHKYIFFCAKPGYNSGHLFAKNNAEHSRNARKYHAWLRQQNIR